MHIKQCILRIIHAEDTDVKSGARRAGVRLRAGGGQAGAA